MKAFMDSEFLLSSETARRLYHDFAEQMPILDYHCHINPQEIAENRQFDNITQVWLGGDHYKWRLLRANGVPEEEITGNAPDRVKFQRFAETLEKAIGNPVYHWSHLELRRYFGYEGHLCADTAEEVWNLCNEKLQQPEFRARSLILNSGVKLLCTTDDPADTLEWHKLLAADETFPVKVLPAWRPDKAMQADMPGYGDYVQKLAAAADMEIRSFSDLKTALKKRLEFFHAMGSRVSDHGMETIAFVPASDEELERIFTCGVAGAPVSAKEAQAFRTALLLFLGAEYSRLGWAMQIHYGVKRNDNQKKFRQLGPDTGFDSIRNLAPADEMIGFFNALEEADALPKTIVYSLDPNDNLLIETVLGCFQGGMCGKMQHGAAWWYNDTKQGMIDQLTSFANSGLLGTFVGMLTDSRSFLSYPRHEYFRRILCNLLGQWVENGEYPADRKALEKIVKGICYDNAMAYFGF